ncbi:MAG: hypothetical protein ACTSUK_11715 [Promethearchaeota archaeon]
MKEKLKIQKAIKKQEGGLVTDAKKLIETTKIFDKDKGLEEGQIRNVLNVALESDCVEVVENFIYYQIGRSKKWSFNKFGESLAMKIRKNEKDSTYETAKQIVLEAGIKENKEHWINDTWHQLTKLYLGYLNRYFYYQKKMQEGQ